MKKMIIIWIIIAITLSGSLLFIGYNVKKHNQEYLTLENDLVEAADVYIKTKDITLKTNEEKKIWGIHTTDASLFMHDNVIAISWEDFGDCSKLEPNREAYKIQNYIYNRGTC